MPRAADRPAAAALAAESAAAPPALPDITVDDGQALIDVAQRKQDADGSTKRKRRVKAPDQPKADPADEHQTRRERKTRSETDLPNDARDDDDDEPRSALIGVPAGSPASRVWLIAAGACAVLVAILSLTALSVRPKAKSVDEVKISWMPGPQIPEREVLAWIRRFPKYEQLAQPNDWLLGQLARFLKDQPAVADVSVVRVYHEPAMKETTRDVRKGGKLVRQTIRGPVITRTVEVKLALRQPYLPGVLRDGTRVWIDRDGNVLPGILPKPEIARPLVRSIEAGGKLGLRSAVQAWDLLENQGLERGLVTDVVLDDLVDVTSPGSLSVAGTPPASRGLVFYTRHGTRILWGRPGEEKYGVSLEDRARNTVHTLTVQGDLARIAAIQVRFPEPTYTLRSTPVLARQ